MSLDAARDEQYLSPFFLRLARGAPFVFMAVLLFGALAWRPTTAPIELETLASAWHMFLSDTLVPLRNGIADPSIPPLLHWVILGGWQVTGVNEWWPRLVPALASLATVLLTLPVIEGIALFTGERIVMALTPIQAGMLLVTLLVSMNNLHDGESNAIEGMSHLALFAGFVAMTVMGVF